MRFLVPLSVLLLCLSMLTVGCDFVDSMFGGDEEKVDQSQLEKRLSDIRRKATKQQTEVQMAGGGGVFEEAGVRTQYDPLNRLDPFKPYSPQENIVAGSTDNPLLRYEVRYFKLVGIIKGPGTSLAIFEDPNRKSYTVRVGDPIGKSGGVIRAILDDAVIVSETKISWSDEGTETVQITIRLRPEEE